MPPKAAAKDRSSIADTKQAPKNQLATEERCRLMCHTRTALPAGAAGRQFCNVVLSACWLCSWLCSSEGKKQTECLPLGLVRARMLCTYFLVCIKGMRKPNPRGDAETPSPGMLRKPGDLPYPCSRSRKSKGLATCDPLHESRPNLRQRDPNGRIVPPPPNASDKGASTKRCFRQKQMAIMRVHIPRSHDSS